MKKARNLVLLLVTIMMIIATLNNVKADSGWDGGYDSGGSSWDSGSSWDYGSSSRGNYSSGNDFFFMFFMFIIFVCISSNSYKNNSQKRNSNTTNNPKIVPLSIDKIKEALPNYNKENLKQELYQIYKDIQIAWMNFDYDKLRELTTDEIYNMYKSQLETLKLKHGQNIMENFELLDFEVVSIDTSNDKIYLSVGLLVSCNDYVIDTVTNKVTRGNKHKTVTYNYLITFVSSKINQNEPNTCPNCGAELENNNSNVCKYCKSPIVSKNHGWIMSKKQNKEQF